MLSKRLPRRILAVLTFLVWAVSAVAFTDAPATGWWLLLAAALLIFVTGAVLARAFGAYALGLGLRLDERQRAAQQRTYTYGAVITATGFGLLVGAHAGEADVTTLSQFAALNFGSGALLALALLFFTANVLAFAWLEPDSIAEDLDFTTRQTLKGDPS